MATAGRAFVPVVRDGRDAVRWLDSGTLALLPCDRREPIAERPLPGQCRGRGLRDIPRVSLCPADQPVDAVLFSLSYSVMPDRREALKRAWTALQPGGRVVIISSFGVFGGVGRVERRADRGMSDGA